MSSYDVVVVGAGPAGGQCARDLAISGAKVLLIEKAADFSVNNFSSGGAPIETMDDYRLPHSTVGSFWHHLSLNTSNNFSHWKSSEKLGVIFDFMKLRSFLADEVILNGGQVLLGHAYKGHRQDGNKTVVDIENRVNRTAIAVEAKIIVDATGTERKVLAPTAVSHQKSLQVTGIEHLISVDPHVYQKFADTLSFYFGMKWMPQGYGWIFPMAPCQLKIGVVRYFPSKTLVPYNPSFNFYLDHLINYCTQGSPHSCLDQHGKTIKYTVGRKDPHSHSNIIAIGDAISMINPMASEGIRHALESGRIASQHIVKELNSPTPSLKNFKGAISKYCGWRWKISERIMYFIYCTKTDLRMDRILESFKALNIHEMMQFAFGYRWQKAAKFFLRYLKLWLKRDRFKNRNAA